MAAKCPSVNHSGVPLADRSGSFDSCLDRVGRKVRCARRRITVFIRSRGIRSWEQGCLGYSDRGGIASCPYYGASRPFTSPVRSEASVKPAPLVHRVPRSMVVKRSAAGLIFRDAVVIPVFDSGYAGRYGTRSPFSSFAIRFDSARRRLRLLDIFLVGLLRTTPDLKQIGVVRFAG